jgi:hypothetical protein
VDQGDIEDSAAPTRREVANDVEDLPAAARRLAHQRDRAAREEATDDVTAARHEQDRASWIA